MKLLAFSDFHGLYGLINHFREVKKRILETRPDLLIFCGDFRNQISIPLLESRLRRLRVPAFFYVWGNSDGVSPDFNLKVGINLHLKLISLNNEFAIAGLGGDELDVQWKIKDLDVILSANNLKLIFVSHVPPYEICDYAVEQKHVGSRPLRALVDKYKPKMHLFGHIHEDAQKLVRVGKTTFINIGPKGYIIDL